ncbi:MAG TPA: hypothetical protein VNJ07_11205 [Chitinophagales bacterium]|nr:hypothetical protein [Chitinophagales bacterium]
MTIKLFLKQAAVFIFFLLCVEFFLFVKGIQPGILCGKRVFKKVDKVVLLDGYIADEFGITSVSQDAAKYLCKYIEKNKKSLRFIEAYRLLKAGHTRTPYIIGRDYVDVNNYAIENEFTSFIKRIREKAHPDPVESAYIDYVKCPINRDGFRSIEFSYIDTDKKKLLLLGDSFTWGHHTENKTNSFADILSSRGYVTYNSGITGTDLPQYYAVAKKYICTLLPDVVIVNLFLGNDIMEYDRKLRPFVPVFYSTNAGLLNTCPQGKYFTDFQSAYNYILYEVSIPRQDENLFNFLSAQTRITTRIWQGLAAHRWVETTPDFIVLNYWDELRELKTGYRINREYLEKIQWLCKEANAELIVSIIPEMDNIRVTRAEIQEKLDGFEFNKIETLTASDYKQSNGHFNEKGHKKYADFLAGLIESLHAEDLPFTHLQFNSNNRKHLNN